MLPRIHRTLGIYKDKKIREDYKNNKIYLFHGTRKRLHTIGGKGKDIEILGFLSTSLNMYTASYYSGIETTGTGIIYIIEVDGKRTYINLKDDLHQFLLLPNSIVRIIHEFNYGPICVILCRLFRTPKIENNNKLFNKLLNKNPPIDMNTYVSYRIKTNNNDMPQCADVLADLWKKNIAHDDDEEFEVYKIKRSKLTNMALNNTSMSQTTLQDQFIYFSLGQEYEIYVERGIPLILGSFEDIKYSLHQHFIKDCYKALDIPCIDYVFVHSAEVDNAIATGIPLKEYHNNRIAQCKYDINNFLIDCIFNFKSFDNDNKKLNLPMDHFGDVDRIGLYADKIEGFRDAGLYLNGQYNPLFTGDPGSVIPYIRNWKHLFSKYSEATDEELSKHFAWCNARIVKLIDIIKATKDKYLHFITKILSQTYEKTSLTAKTKAANEILELTNMIEELSQTLIKRAEFYIRCTNTSEVPFFIVMIKKVLSCEHTNIHNSTLFNNAILEDLILNEEKEKSDSLRGGLSKSEMKKQNMHFVPEAKSKTSGKKKIDFEKMYETFKNIPIQESKDMRKFKDMPKSFQEYYKGAILDKDGCFDISDHCYCRTI
jgi:hypothetical protein